jgi:hypothetical protein
MNDIHEQPEPQASSPDPIVHNRIGRTLATAVMTISAMGTIATTLSTELGIPRWLTACLFGGYLATIVILVGLCVRYVDRPSRHRIAHGVLKAIAPWWHALLAAVSPEERTIAADPSKSD